MILYKLIIPNKMEKLDRYGYVGEFNYYSNHQIPILCLVNYKNGKYWNSLDALNNKNIILYYSIYTFSQEMHIINYLKKIDYYEKFNNIVKELSDDGELLEYIHNYLDYYYESCYETIYDNFTNGIRNEMRKNSRNSTGHDLYSYFGKCKDQLKNIMNIQDGLYKESVINTLTKCDLINQYNLLKQKYDEIIKKKEYIYSIINNEKLNEINDKWKIFIDELIYHNNVNYEYCNYLILCKFQRKEYYNEYCIYEYIHKDEKDIILRLYISNYFNIYYQTECKNGRIYILDDDVNPEKGKIKINYKTNNNIILDNESIDLIKNYGKEIDGKKNNCINLILLFANLIYIKNNKLNEQEKYMKNLNEKLDSSIELINILQDKIELLEENNKINTILQTKIELLEKKVFRKSPKV